MLLVKTKLALSSIPNAGLGLYADEFIPKGKIVWKLDTNFDRLISKEDFLKCNAVQRDYISTYGFTTKNYPFIILCMDDGRFVNHSKDGNLNGKAEELFGDMHYSIAMKDIQPGEELLENYSLFDDKTLDLAGNKSHYY